MDEIINKVPVTYYQQGMRSNLFQKIWHGKKIGLAKKVISKNFRNGRSFNNCLDVGCASGFMISKISEQFPDKKFFGVDVYQRAIAYGKKNYPGIDFKVGAAEKIPYKEGSFDLVVCYETIEHVVDPLKSLKEIRRVMKKNGIAIITMDSGNWLFRIVWFVWERTKGKVWQGAHLHPFHHAELGRMIKKADLQIKEKIFSHWGMEVTYVAKKQ